MNLHMEHSPVPEQQTLEQFENSLSESTPPTVAAAAQIAINRSAAMAMHH